MFSGEYLKEQVEAIKELGDLVTKMKRVGDGYGLYQLDKDMAEWRTHYRIVNAAVCMQYIFKITYILLRFT